MMVLYFSYIPNDHDSINQTYSPFLCYCICFLHQIHASNLTVKEDTAVLSQLKGFYMQCIGLKEIKRVKQSKRTGFNICNKNFGQ